MHRDNRITLQLGAYPYFPTHEPEAQAKARIQLQCDHVKLIDELLSQDGDSLEMGIYSRLQQTVKSRESYQSEFSYVIGAYRNLDCLRRTLASLQHLRLKPQVGDSRQDAAFYPSVKLYRKIVLTQVGNPSLFNDSNLSLLHPTDDLLIKPDFNPDETAEKVVESIETLAHNIGRKSNRTSAIIAAGLVAILARHVMLNTDVFRKKVRSLAELATQAYLVPVPNSLSKPVEPRWRETLKELRDAGDDVRIQCTRRQPDENDRVLARKVLEALNKTYRPLDINIMKEKFHEVTRLFCAITAGEPLYETEIQITGPNREVLAKSFADDNTFKGDDAANNVGTFETENLLFDEKLNAFTQAHGNEYLFALRRYRNSWLKDEVVSLLTSPYTFTDALSRLTQYAVKPFYKASLVAKANNPHIVLGLQKDGTEAQISVDDINGHVFVTGRTGSGKTTTIMRIVQQLHDNCGVGWLIIDPCKVNSSYRQLLLGRDANLIDAAKDSFRFNPFICPKNVQIRDHAGLVARAFTLLFPVTETGATIIHDMVLHTYVRMFEREVTLSPYVQQHYNGKNVRGSREVSCDVLKKTGEYLSQYPYCIPTFDDFLIEGINLLEERRSIADGEAIRETLAFFKNTYVHTLSSSRFAEMMSPPDKTESIERLFTGCHLLETGGIGNRKEADTLVTLIVTLLGEYRKSKQNASGQTAKTNKSAPLDFVLVIDEAHNIVPADPGTNDVKLTNSPATELANEVRRIIAEIRECGVAVIVGTQSACNIDRDVLANTCCKIVHSVEDGRDKENIGKALGLEDDQRRSLRFLQRGEAVVSLAEVPHPFLVSVAPPAPPPRALQAGSVITLDEYYYTTTS